jgi:hypothetical protein
VPVSNESGGVFYQSDGTLDVEQESRLFCPRKTLRFERLTLPMIINIELSATTNFECTPVTRDELVASRSSAVAWRLPFKIGPITAALARRLPH